MQQTERNRNRTLASSEISFDGGIEIGDNRMETLGLFESDVVPTIVDDVKAAFGSLPKLTNG